MRRLGTTDFGDEEIGADDVRYVARVQTTVYGAGVTAIALAFLILVLLRIRISSSLRILIISA